MQNNNPNDYLQEEIYLKDIIKLLINSKKLIIVTTLIVTLLGAIYSFQKAHLPLYKSTALIEVGKYYQNPTKQILIESTKNLIKELSIHFIHKQQTNLSVNSIENSLINIYSTSVDPAKNTDLLNKVIQYIENRHSLLLSENKQRMVNQLTYEIESLNDQIESLNDQIEYTDKILFTQNEAEKIRITGEIESLNNQIEYSNKVLLTQNNDEKIRITNEIESLNKQIEYTNEIFILNNELPAIDLKINALNKIILEDQNNLKLLESNPDLFIQRTAKLPTLNQVIHSYNIQLLDLEAEKVNLVHSNSYEIFKLTQEKDNLESQLKRLETNNLESDSIFNLSQEKDGLQIELKLLEINSQEIDGLQIELKLLENNVQQSEEIFRLSQEKNRLDLELKFLMEQNPTSTQLIGEIVTNTINLKKDLTIFLSFILGLFLSIMLVFFNNFYKALKED
jgi:hypothetical protein